MASPERLRAQGFVPVAEAIAEQRAFIRQCGQPTLALQTRAGYAIRLVWVFPRLVVEAEWDSHPAERNWWRLAALFQRLPEQHRPGPLPGGGLPAPVEQADLAGVRSGHAQRVGLGRCPDVGAGSLAWSLLLSRWCMTLYRAPRRVARLALVRFDWAWPGSRAAAHRLEDLSETCPEALDLHSQARTAC